MNPPVRRFEPKTYTIYTYQSEDTSKFLLNSAHFFLRYNTTPTKFVSYTASKTRGQTDSLTDRNFLKIFESYIQDILKSINPLKTRGRFFFTSPIPSYCKDRRK